VTLPVDVDTVMVSGTFVDNDDGTPCAGTVEFVPHVCHWAAPSTTIIGTPVTVTLDAAGHFDVELIATDDTDLNPVDWTYQVRVRVRAGDYASAYSFDMAAPSGAAIDLADVTPVYASDGNAVVVGPPGPEGPPGPPGEEGPPGAPGSGGITVAGVLDGASTPLPSSAEVGELWVLGSPVPTAAPDRADDTAAQEFDGIVWTAESIWLNVGPIQGPAGSDGTDGATGPAGATGATGPAGATGPQGAQGPQGPSGAAAGGHASFTFNSNTSEPVTGNQLRINNASQTAATRLWVSKTDTDGLDVSIGLAKVLAGHQIYFQDFDDASKWVKYSVTADGVDDGAYYDFVVAYHSGPANVPFQKVELMPIAPGAVGVPPGGATSLVLAKSSATDYAVGWVTGRWLALSQAAYDAIPTKDPSILYVITG
jgi:hypothetical protein